MPQPMMQSQVGMNTNTNSNVINIDLGESSDEEETNYALLMVMKENIPDIYCPVCDDERMTICEESYTPMALLVICCCCIFFFPIACCILASGWGKGHEHKCSVCQTTLYNSEA